VRLKNGVYGAVMGLLLTATTVLAANLRADMEASNTEWLAAYNT
jgi:hypothetical protein